MSTTTPTEAPSQRDRILDIALALMAERGASGTSMRQLAKACDLNVAAIYHYFPSKAELLRSVIEERRYGLRLQELPVVEIDPDPRRRLVILIETIWQGALEEEAIWRLLLGEGLRGDETALAVSRELLEVIEPALREWLGALFADTTLDHDAMTQVIMAQLFSFFVTHLFRPDAERAARVHQQAEAIATLAFGPTSR